MQIPISILILSLLFLLLIDLISSESKNRKYINTTCSVLLITSLLSPYLNLFNDISYELDNAISYLENNDINYLTSTESTICETFLNKEYENKLIESFNRLVEENDIKFSGYVEFIYEKDTQSEDFGIIKEVIITYTLLSESDSVKLQDILSSFYAINSENILISAIRGNNEN